MSANVLHHLSLIILLAAAARIRAEAAPRTVCVSDNTTLDFALSNAALFAEDIHIVQGTYTIASSSELDFSFAAGSSLRGDYTAHCAAPARRHLCHGDRD
jgi:hypothetical protein